MKNINNNNNINGNVNINDNDGNEEGFVSTASRMKKIVLIPH